MGGVAADEEGVVFGGGGGFCREGEADGGGEGGVGFVVDGGDSELGAVKYAKVVDWGVLALNELWFFVIYVFYNDAFYLDCSALRRNGLE